MTSSSNTENLILQARSGDQEAKQRFYDTLAVRFLPIVTCELRRHAVLQNSGMNLEKEGQAICRQAVEEIIKLCPVEGTQWSLKRAVHILHNITDDAIVNALVPLAKKDHAEAENLLFVLIRNNLMQWMERKGWKKSG